MALQIQSASSITKALMSSPSIQTTRGDEVAADHAVFQGAFCLLHEMAHWEWFEHRHGHPRKRSEMDLAYFSEPEGEAGCALEYCLLGAHVHESTQPAYFRLHNNKKTHMPARKIKQYLSKDYWRNLIAFPPLPRRDLPSPWVYMFLTGGVNHSLSVEIHALRDDFMIPSGLHPPLFIQWH